MVRESEKVLDRAASIVYNMSIVESRTKSTDYDSPSWSHKQAHLNGRLEALREIASLLKVSDKDQ